MNSAPKDAEVAYNFFHENHNAILHKHYPMETLTKKQQELEIKPWITRGIRGGQGTLNPARMTKSGYSAVLRTKGYHPLYRGKM